MNEPLGTAADEAVRLLGAAQEWVRSRLDDEHLATGSYACTACPLCQAVGALRHIGPDTVGHLLDSDLISIDRRASAFQTLATESLRLSY